MRLLAILACRAVAQAYAVQGATWWDKDWTDEHDKESLAKLRTRDGVKELSDGLLYKVLEKGNGTKHPLRGTKCLIHWEGLKMSLFMENNETAYESTYTSYTKLGKAIPGKPMEVKPNLAPWHFKPLKAFEMILPLMVVGEKIEVYSPSELAYGADGKSPRIPPHAAIVFRIGLLRIGAGKKDRHHEL